jgi:hypothetical protein
VRYAANRAAVAARERFPGRVITEPLGDLWLVELAPLPAALHLTHQANLDVLGLDDRVSTGRLAGEGRPDPDPLLDTCAVLSDRVYDWWSGRPPPLVYRSRTAPGRGRNACFAEWACPPVRRAGLLRSATSLLAHLVLHAGFTVPAAWLA